eukprot:3262030-Lingulodinium_polyedra.AAC.1
MAAAAAARAEWAIKTTLAQLAVQKQQQSDYAAAATGQAKRRMTATAEAKRRKTASDSGQPRFWDCLQQLGTEVP